MLYIVSTPIGNLKDISERALETLRSVDVIIAESPEDSVKLLNAYEIKGKGLFKYNDRNMRQVQGKVEEILKSGDVAYITSAGTPGISDPGQELVKTARNLGIEVRIIPGPSALVSAIAVSGLRSRQFTFISFPPKKPGQLRNLFKDFLQKKETLVFFESTHRIVKTVEAVNEVAPKCSLFVAKEMTKMFENYFLGFPDEVLDKLRSSPKNIKGEFVVIIDFSSSCKR
jgi:16S rRNA (cytidine1402-2'-O)-methyltransferase